MMGLIIMSLTVLSKRFHCNIVFRVELVRIKSCLAEILNDLELKVPTNFFSQHSTHKHNCFFSFKVL